MGLTKKGSIWPVPQIGKNGGRFCQLHQKSLRIWTAFGTALGRKRQANSASGGCRPQIWTVTVSKFLDSWLFKLHFDAKIIQLRYLFFMFWQHPIITIISAVYYWWNNPWFNVASHRFQNDNAFCHRDKDMKTFLQERPVSYINWQVFLEGKCKVWLTTKVWLILYFIFYFILLLFSNECWNFMDWTDMLYGMSVIFLKKIKQLKGPYQRVAFPFF